MRTARAKVEGAAYYHVMNRILERRYILKDEVAEKFCSIRIVGDRIQASLTTVETKF